MPTLLTETNAQWTEYNGRTVTLDGLNITGAFTGIFAGSNTDNTRLTVARTVLYGNANAGADLEVSNDRPTFQSDTVYGNPYGIYLSSVNDATVTDEKLVLTPAHLTPEGVIKLSMGKKKHLLLRPA